MAIISPPPLRGADSSNLDPDWKVAKELLELNHEKNHVFFNHPELFHGILLHNHLAHHVLTIYSLGGHREDIKRHFDDHSVYQRDKPAYNSEISAGLQDFEVFKRCLGAEHHYGNFLQFFKSQMQEYGYEKTVDQVMFAKSEVAKEVFSRMFAGTYSLSQHPPRWLLSAKKLKVNKGVLHPLIQTGFGIEFELPLLVCEGMAMACTQPDEYGIQILKEVEQLSRRRDDSLTLVEILDLCNADSDLVNAATLPADFELLGRSGLLGTMKDKLLEYASRFTVEESEIELRSAELCNATSYILAGAQRHGKEPRMDFFLMHLTNTSILADAAAHKNWINSEGKARLLSWLGRMSVILYSVMGSPKLDLGVIRNFKPRQGHGGWQDSIKRSRDYNDDGHGCKMVRAILHTANVSRPYEGQPGFRMAGSDFEKAAIAVVESFLPNDQVGRAGPDQNEAWIRMAGFDSAWEKVPDLIIN